MTTKLDKAMDKFWPQLPYPLSFADALGTLSKQQLTSIRTNLQISNLSSLNKQGLVEKLSELIPENLSMATRCFDHNRLKLVQKIVKNDGFWDKPLLEPQQYEYFRERGILFPSTVDGKKVVLMPSELLAYFKEVEAKEEHPNIKRNTEWIRQTQGLLYYYGVLTADELKSFIITGEEHPLDQYELMNILFEASDYYELIVMDETNDLLICDFRVTDPQAILKERALRHDLDYCPFTKQQLLKAGEPEYVERSSQYMNLVRYVLHHYEIDREEADFMAEECVDATKNGDSLATVIEIAQRFIDIPNRQTLTAITNLLVPLMNSTKQWLIKGYSPEELSAKRASASMLLNNAPIQAVQADVIDIQSKKKIGRNDPCTCGSGKKFKKCCG
ncbi:SEC-C metal-binding domain-containing protein [Bacillus sp. FJAT-26390]|uniref:SEC-C metal-binding domain-containing protein n=1 Tax=Bacillus sp. FJAT-26390 TaxID=1743142 RepID=UPI000807D452|nr:SEC-C metal-binding domain-containing protein [Bacillus sp. FJAT-26390]OBZ15176.1 hypothetical protein A7975_32370 [Bacillus sp. FJAT-26390]